MSLTLRRPVRSYAIVGGRIFPNRCKMDAFDLPGPEVDGFDHKRNAEMLAADRDRRTAAAVAEQLGVSRSDWEGYVNRAIRRTLAEVLPAIAGEIVAAGLVAASQRDTNKETIIDLLADDLADMVASAMGNLHES